MNTLISFCGINCNECDAYQATLNNDDEKRKEVALLWSKQYNAEIKPVDINCDGCVSDGKNLFNHCNVCEIRKCGKEKGVLNCAHCEEYICEKRGKFFEMVPFCKKNLDEIKNGL